MADREPSRSQTFVTAFARGLSLIEAFGPQSHSMTVAEAAKRIDLDRAVTRRLLRTLVDLGCATANGRQFELSPKTLKLGCSFLASAGLAVTLKSDALSPDVPSTGVARHA